MLFQTKNLYKNVALVTFQSIDQEYKAKVDGVKSLVLQVNATLAESDKLMQSLKNQNYLSYRKINYHIALNFLYAPPLSFTTLLDLISLLL